MAFIATYISTVSGGSELSSYFEEVSEWTATADVTAHELAVKESYDYVNSFLDAYMSVPIAKEPTTGRYHPLVRWSQAKVAVAMMRERKMGSANELVAQSWESAAAAIKAMVEARSQFEMQTSPDEVGCGPAVPASANTSTAQIISEVGADFDGDHEQTYTITITTGGAVATAVYSWADGEGNTTTAVTTSYEWRELENGLRVRCKAGTFVLNDTWTIRCAPIDSSVTTPAGSIGNITIRK